MFTPFPAVDAASSAVSSSSLCSAPPRVHLHRHALESIFGFLTIAELAAVSRVSQEWSARTLTTVPLRASFVVAASSDVPPFPAAKPLVTSRLAIHLQRFQQTSASISAVELSLLVDSAPHLTELIVDLVVSPSAPVSFPAKLRSLHLTLRSNPSQFNRILVAIGSLCELELLNVLFSVASSADLDFAPLQQIPTLRSLKLRYNGDWTTQQMDQFRALPQLATIDIGSASAWLTSLLRVPHFLRWEEVVHAHLWPSIDALLVALPLQRMGHEAAPVFVMETMQCLHALGATLTCLHLDLMLAIVTPSEVVSALCCCVHLADLGLGHAPLSSDHMRSVLRSTHALRSLLLCEMAVVDSLAFLADEAAPMLDSLKLVQMRRLACDEVLALRHQTRLRTLSLRHSFDDGLPEATLALIRPPSAWFPMLTSLMA